MKLNHIYNILKENQQNLTLQRKRTSDNIQDMFQINSVQPTITSLRNIEKLSIFNSVSNFKDMYPVFWSWTEESYSDRGGVTGNIINSLDFIRNEVSSVFNTLEKFIPKDEGYIISIKLPEYEQLNDLPTFYTQLDNMLSPLIEYFSDDVISIHSFENGSKWNDFAVKNKDTINIILAFLTIGISLKLGISQIEKDKLEMEKTYLEIQQIKNNEIEDMPESMYAAYEWREEREYDTHIIQFIQVLKEEQIETITLGRAEEEIKTIIKRSFKSYQLLLKDGTEFYGQIDEEDNSINKWVEMLDTSQKLLIHQNNLEHLTEGNIKSLTESTYEEMAISIDEEDED